MTSITVVATLTPKPGALDEVLEIYRDFSPHAHSESGCELYAVYSNASTVVIIERWASQADQLAHSSSPEAACAVAKLDPLLVGPAEVNQLNPQKFGSADLGDIGA